MFDGADDDMALGRAVLDHRPRSSKQGQIIGLGGAACKNDFVRIGTDQVSDLASCSGNRLRSTSAVRMRARRVAELLAQPGQHGIQHFWCDRVVAL
jgi:hypothetical protein